MRYRKSIMIPINYNTIIVPFVLNIAIGIQPRFKTTTALYQNNNRQVSITTLSDGTTICYDKTMISTIQFNTIVLIMMMMVL